MNNKLSKLIAAALLACAILTPTLALAQEHHDDHRYYDKRHRDYHNWDAHEDRAYHLYWEQRHRQYVAFETLNEQQQANYWAWRHSHSDALLKIDIR